MVRTQIQLTKEQVIKLKKMSSARHISMAKLIRQAIDQNVRYGDIVDIDERIQRAISAAGRFRSGLKDLAKKHDQYLGDAFGK